MATTQKKETRIWNLKNVEFYIILIYICYFFYITLNKICVLALILTLYHIYLYHTYSKSSTFHKLSPLGSPPLVTHIDIDR